MLIPLNTLEMSYMNTCEGMVMTYLLQKVATLPIGRKNSFLCGSPRSSLLGHQPLHHGNNHEMYAYHEGAFLDPVQFLGVFLK